MIAKEEIRIKNVIVHIMDAKNREFYALEHTWNDGKELSVEELVNIK